MSLASMLKGRGPSGFGYGSTAEEVTLGLDLTGKRVLLTGCNSGIGLETMRVLALRGATVIGAARTIEKAGEACASVKGATIPVACELADPPSVRACVRAVSSMDGLLDAIIANAGIMALPRAETVHGVEKQLFTNHFGHFVLVTGLLDRLAPGGRVVVLSSAAHTGAPRAGIEFDNLDGARAYKPFRAYGQSKLANLLFARELARRLDGAGQVCNAVHPGVIGTNLNRHMSAAVNAVFGLVGPLFLKTIPQGAATQCWAAVHPDTARINGQYLSDCNLAESSPQGRDPALAQQLWKVTEERVAGLG